MTPVFLLLVFGTIVYGMYFGVSHSLQQLAAEAARAAVSGITATERDELVRARIRDSIRAYGMLRQESLRIETAFDAVDPDLYRVNLTYDATHLGLGAFAAILPTPPETITRNAVIRRGGT